VSLASLAKNWRVSKRVDRSLSCNVYVAINSTDTIFAAFLFRVTERTG
jgi:hypothetical protein